MHDDARRPDNRGVGHRWRVGVGGFLHETNTFAPSPAGYEHFVEGGGWPGLCRGASVIDNTLGVNVSMAGFAAEAEARGWELVPALWCAASPSGSVRRDAYERIAGELIRRLVEAAPLDAIYLDLHGAMVAEHLPDGEGELLRRLREAVGPELPIVASLDLHANVTPLMVANADMLVIFRTYPHVDMADTGKRAAEAVAPLLGAAERPAKAFRQIPFLIPVVWQRTAAEPCRTIYAELARSEGGAVTSLSFAPGFPAADFPDCRPSVLAYGRTAAAAEAAAEALATLVGKSEVAFNGTLLSAAEATRMAILRGRAGRPVVIADVQDNPGAGSNSDTTGLLRALVDASAEGAALGLMVDPDAAAMAHKAGIGATVRVGLGGRSLPGDAPLEADYRVEALSDGRLTTSGPYYGSSPMNLGPSARLRLGVVRIIVSSHKAQMADLEMFRFLGVEPAGEAILAVKSSVHFRAHFEPIAGEVLVCASPGFMPMDPGALPWRHLAEGVRLGPMGQPFRATG